MSYLSLLDPAARRQNGWEVVGAVQVHAGGNGYVPHGVAIVKRDHSPLGAGREYATVGWNIHLTKVPVEARVSFDSGHYDLTAEEALADLMDRAKGVAP